MTKHGENPVKEEYDEYAQCDCDIARRGEQSHFSVCIIFTGPVISVAVTVSGAFCVFTDPVIFVAVAVSGAFYVFTDPVISVAAAVSGVFCIFTGPVIFIVVAVFGIPGIFSGIAGLIPVEYGNKFFL